LTTLQNIRTIAGYYRRITMNRFAQLLFLSVDVRPPSLFGWYGRMCTADVFVQESEKILSDLVVKKSVWARIDRPKGVINFTKAQEPTEVLNDWAHNVSELLELVEKTCHLIHRENMVHKV
jgi:26S proteasome regulatory subunit N5